MDKIESAELTKQQRRNFTRALWDAVNAAAAAGLDFATMSSMVRDFAADVKVEGELREQESHLV